MLTIDQQKRLQDADYKLIGPNKHAAVKLCHWTKKSIKSSGKDFCYKQKFYGIRSHQCIQMTPDLPVCNLRCSYCWRDFSYFKNNFSEKMDCAETIVKESILAQQKLLVGLGGVEHDKNLLAAAMLPKHAAISLDGEPTLYPHLAELIKCYHGMNMTTFLVTNGTNLERLRALAEDGALPTQLYISLSANSKEMFNNVQHPVNGTKIWDNILETLNFLPELKTRTVIRLTMIKNLNMQEPERYAKLISMARPDFIEVKGWMAVGQSRQRIPAINMPNHKEICDFSAELVKHLPYYHVEDEQEVSRVVLLMREAGHRLIKPCALIR